MHENLKIEKHKEKAGESGYCLWGKKYCLFSLLEFYLHYSL